MTFTSTNFKLAAIFDAGSQLDLTRREEEKFTLPVLIQQHEGHPPSKWPAEYSVILTAHDNKELKCFTPGPFLSCAAFAQGLIILRIGGKKTHG